VGGEHGGRVANVGTTTAGPCFISIESDARAFNGTQREALAQEQGNRVITLFRHHIPIGASFQALADGVLYFCATLLAVHVALTPYGVAPESVTGPAMLFAFIALVVGAAFGIYRNADEDAFAAQIGRAVLVVLVSAGAASLLFEYVQGGPAAREVLGYIVLYSLASILVARQIMLTARRAGVGRRPVLIVGSADEARAVEGTLQAGVPKFAVTGFYDPASEVFSERELCDLVERLGVREVIVAVRDQRGGAVPMKQLLECRLKGISVIDLAGFFEREHGQVPVHSLKSSWLVYGKGFAQSPTRTVVKRAFDVTCALGLLALAAPVMVLAAAAIAVESGRPVLYRQERVGRGGRPFNCIKFRSMTADAEKDGIARWASKGDPRVTRVGRLLRKSRIDELPQLFNVLRGEMSLVGPRPERPAFVKDLSLAVPYYDVRHSVKPGVTGWAQVRYKYGASVEDATRKLQYDLYYVKNHSLFLDILILVETVRVVLFGEGAH
jgi:sugar transferase (PEP-CTERM system associated)